MAGHLLEKESLCAEEHCQSTSSPTGPTCLTMLETLSPMLACIGPGMRMISGLATHDL